MRIATALTVSALVFIMPPALANDRHDRAFAEQVPHHDVDLSTKEGVALLDARVRTIIRRECTNGGRDSVSLRLEAQCRAKAIAAAQDDIRLAVQHAQKRKALLAAMGRSTPES